MNRVAVDLAESNTKRRSNNARSQPNRRYTGWAPSDYSGEQLRRDAAEYWQLDAAKYELVDGVGHAVVGDDTRLDSLTASSFTLRKRRSVCDAIGMEERRQQAMKSDPFWLQEKLFDVFLVHTLPHWNGKGSPTISSYQFKQLVLKAAASARQRGVTVKKFGHDLTVRVVLAFKTATPNSAGAGAQFHEFLDALVDVAAALFARNGNESKEQALEKLATRLLIPYYDQVERDSVHRFLPSWSILDEAVLTRPKVQSLLQRFTPSLVDIALAYSTTIVGTRRYRGLQFHEFSRLVHDIKPTLLSITTLELCFCFIHCCRLERGGGFAIRTPHLQSSDSYSSLLNGVMEISCSHIAHVFAYIALLSVPPLAASRRAPTSDTRPLANGFRSKLAVQSIKAFMYLVAMRLTSVRHTTVIVDAAPSRFAGMKKDTTLPLVSVGFLQELQRMHREDAMEDYVSRCRELLEMEETRSMDTETISDIQQVPVRESHQCKTEDAQPEQETVYATVAEDTDADLGLEIDWGDNEEEEEAEADNSGNSDAESDSSVDHQRVLSPERLARQQQREEDEILSHLNDADEIYVFLASELHNHAIDNRLHDQEMVPSMLDIWAVAGQKYAQVISYFDTQLAGVEGDRLVLLERKLGVLERFGASLYVFAMQLLKSTTKVFQYEELFHVTNARVYGSVYPLLWDDRMDASFTKDLATETLSLASGKLSAAASVIEELRRLEQAGGAPQQPEVQMQGGLVERYLQCLVHRANCLSVYGDVLAHNKQCAVDFELGCTLEEDQDTQLSSTTTIEPDAPLNYHSSVVLAKTSPPGHFYREAKRIFKFVIHACTTQGVADHWLPILHDRVASVQFKLATHLPRGCVAEKRLMTDLLHHLTTAQHLNTQLGLVGNRSGSSADQIKAKRDYVAAVRVLRSKFFQPETDAQSFADHDADSIVPFYRFVLVAAIREIDPHKTGVLTQTQLSQLNSVCGRSAVSDSTMNWLVASFDHLKDGGTIGLSEKGVFQYFCWLAESDPVTFCDILDILTAKHTETPTSIASPQSGRELRGKSLKPTLFNQVRQRASESILTTTTSTMVKTPTNASGIADCVVIVTARMTPESCSDIAATASPCDVRLQPEVLDALPEGADVPEELSKFCFPDDPFMANELLPPKTFDIVLTDMTGVRLYGTCIQFFEERDPIDVLTMISSVQRGSKSASLPSWISLKDIQQRKATTRCFIPKCVCILSSVPLFQTFRESLKYLYRLSISMPPFPIESMVYNLLEQVHVPTAVNSLTAFSMVDHVRLLMALPMASPTLYPTELDFTLLFQCLSSENILKVYGYLLTEKKVVLSSRNVSILTPVAETLRALMYPFDCQVVYIPVLPLALIDFVTSPVPFFMGVRSDESLNRLTTEGVVVVYLDKDEVAEPEGENLPTLPDVRAKKLLQALRKTSAWIASQQTRAQYGRFDASELTEITSFPDMEVSDIQINSLVQQQEDWYEKWSELYLLFTTFCMRMLKDFRKFCRASTGADGHETTVFDRKAFLAMHPSQREFCSHLFHTQHFQRFIEHSTSLSDSVLQLAASDAEERWRNVRAKTGIIRRGDSANDVDSLKSQPRQITRAPPPPRYPIASVGGAGSPPTHRRRPSGRQGSMDVFGAFHSHIYEELRAAQSADQAREATATAPTPRRSLNLESSMTKHSHTSLPIASAVQIVARHRMGSTIELG